MSPDNKKKLLILRKKLDSVDDKLLNLLKIRANHVKKVLSLKEFKKEIIDRKRINLILKNVKIKSLKKGIDPKINNRIWKNMIYAFIEFEFEILEKRKIIILCEVVIFFNKISYFLITGLYFLANFILAFSPPDSFLT